MHIKIVTDVNGPVVSARVGVVLSVSDEIGDLLIYEGYAIPTDEMPPSPKPEKKPVKAGNHGFDV